MKFIKEWIDFKRAAESPPDPKYPAGMDIDLSAGAWITCTALLEYPAKGCGLWSIRCETCNFTAAITTAGRADDPRSVKVPCKNPFIKPDGETLQ